MYGKRENPVTSGMQFFPLHFIYLLIFSHTHMYLCVRKKDWEEVSNQLGKPQRASMQDVGL